MKLLLWHAFVSLFIFLKEPEVAAGEVSECNFVFIYEVKNPDANHWYGNVRLLSDVDISGMWLEITFDKPVEFLQTWDGNLVFSDGKTFLISNPSFVAKANTPRKIGLFVMNKPNEPISKPTKILFNGKEVCIQEWDPGAAEPAASKEIIVSLTNPKENLPKQGESLPDYVVFKIQFLPVTEKKNHDEISPFPPLNISSPCPAVFDYTSKASNSDRWLGEIVLYSDTDLNGIRLEITFDKPILKLETWFGKVEEGEQPNTYLIKSSFALKARTMETVRFSVQYNRLMPHMIYPNMWANIDVGVPKLVGIRLNGKQVCPANIRAVARAVMNTATEWLVAKNTSKTARVQHGTNPTVVHDEILFEDDLRRP